MDVATPGEALPRVLESAQPVVARAAIVSLVDCSALLVGAGTRAAATEGIGAASLLAVQSTSSPPTHKGGGMVLHHVGPTPRSPKPVTLELSYADVLVGSPHSVPRNATGAGSQLPAGDIQLLPQLTASKGKTSDAGIRSLMEPAPEKKLRRSLRSSVNDEHTLAKTERMAAKRNLECSGTNSFTSMSNSQIETRVSNLGVSLGRDSSEINSSVISRKNIEIDRLSIQY